MDQDYHKAHHWIQLLCLGNHLLCPVWAPKSLLKSRPLPPTAPLFANNFHPHNQVIDTHIQDALKKVLVHRNISLKGHGFHTFRGSGATLAFYSDVKIHNIMAHGFWHSSAIWSYLENASQANLCSSLLTCKCNFQTVYSYLYVLGLTSI